VLCTRKTLESGDVDGFGVTHVSTG
jgi:hypothetical protein